MVAEPGVHFRPVFKFMPSVPCLSSPQLRHEEGKGLMGMVGFLCCRHVPNVPRKRPRVGIPHLPSQENKRRARDPERDSNGKTPGPSCSELFSHAFFTRPNDWGKLFARRSGLGN